MYDRKRLGERRTETGRDGQTDTERDQKINGPFQDQNIFNAANDSPKPVQTQRGNVSKHFNFAIN